MNFTKIAQGTFKSNFTFTKQLQAKNSKYISHILKRIELFFQNGVWSEKKCKVKERPKKNQSPITLICLLLRKSALPSN